MQQLIESFEKRMEQLPFEHIHDHPNILIAAHFWDQERYQAALSCYRLMRYVDDLIDNYKTEHLTFSAKEQGLYAEKVNAWLQDIRNKNIDTPLGKEVAHYFDRFHLPIWPMEAFAHSMLYDIKHDGFKTVRDFLTYAEGASVAPAAIFVHLAGLKKTANGFAPPTFDVKQVASSCAIFSYLVHIIRDFQKDRHNHLNYFADDLLASNGLDQNALQEMATGKDIHPGFRKMIRSYYDLAGTYRAQTLETIDKIHDQLEPEGQLSLDIIFNLYDMVYQRIDPEHGNFSTEDLNPTSDEMKASVAKTIQNFKN
jgi:phytoene/squalene synthetase